MKKFIPVMIIGLIISMAVSSYFNRVESALSDNVLRLHVIANSDSDFDQQLKLKVRDKILQRSDSIFSKKSDISEAKKNIKYNLEEIEKIACAEVAANGCDYPVKVTFGKSDFPTKAYGNVTLPAGTYEALKVEIGEAKGKNWWCVMFPPLCFVDASSPEMSAEAMAMLKDNLSEDEYALITNSENKNVEIKFKAYEIWQSGKNKVKLLMK